MPPLGPPKRTARQQAIAEWRKTDLSSLEKARANAARSAGDIMPRVLADIRMDRRRSEAEVAKVWNNLLDPKVVAHAQPTGLRNGTLFVAVDSSAWLSEIVRYRRKEILDRLQHSFGPDVITRISFRVG
jgi:hypothetical protein